MTYPKGKPKSEESKQKARDSALSSEKVAARRVIFEVRPCLRCGTAYEPSSAQQDRERRFCTRVCGIRYAAEQRAAAPLKRCSSCREYLPRAQFRGDKDRVDGLQPYCTTCHRYQVVKSKYGLTREQFDAMVDPDNGCAICGKRGRLVVDHCHQTGAVRGLLCGPCNSGMGYFKDDPERMELAIAYLRAAVKA